MRDQFGRTVRGYPTEGRYSPAAPHTDGRRGSDLLDVPEIVARDRSGSVASWTERASQLHEEAKMRKRRMVDRPGQLLRQFSTILPREERTPSVSSRPRTESAASSQPSAMEAGRPPAVVPFRGERTSVDPSPTSTLAMLMGRREQPSVKAAVLDLAYHGRDEVDREERAVIVIQRTFRGYLARKLLFHNRQYSRLSGILSRATEGRPSAARGMLSRMAMITNVDLFSFRRRLAISIEASEGFARVRLFVVLMVLLYLVAGTQLRQERAFELKTDVRRNIEVNPRGVNLADTTSMAGFDGWVDGLVDLWPDASPADPQFVPIPHLSESFLVGGISFTQTRSRMIPCKARQARGVCQSQNPSKQDHCWSIELPPDLKHDMLNTSRLYECVSGETEASECMSACYLPTKCRTTWSCTGRGGSDCEMCVSYGGTDRSFLHVVPSIHERGLIQRVAFDPFFGPNGRYLDRLSKGTKVQVAVWTPSLEMMTFAEYSASFPISGFAEASVQKMSAISLEVDGSSIALRVLLCLAALIDIVAHVRSEYKTRNHGYSYKRYQKKTRSSLKILWWTGDFVFYVLLFVTIGLDIEVVTEADGIWLPEVRGFYFIDPESTFEILRDDPLRFTDTSALARLVRVYAIAVGFIALYGILRVFRFIRFSGRVALLTASVEASLEDLAPVFPLVLLFFVGNAIAAVAMFGSSAPSFRDVQTAAYTLFNLSFGLATPYDEIEELEPVSTAVFYPLFVVSSIMLVVNWLIALTLDSFAATSQHPDFQHSLTDEVVWGFWRRVSMARYRSSRFRRGLPIRYDPTDPNAPPPSDEALLDFLESQFKGQRYTGLTELVKLWGRPLSRSQRRGLETCLFDPRFDDVDETRMSGDDLKRLFKDTAV